MNDLEWTLGVSIIGAGGLIAYAIERLRECVDKQGDLLRARFCDFAFEPDLPSERDNMIARSSQLRWLVREIYTQRTGNTDHPGS